MGMDLVELILEVEERYAVELEGDDFANIRTFGDLIDTVKRKIDRPLDLPVEETGYEIIFQSLLTELRLRLPANVEVDADTQLHKLRRYVKNYEVWSVIQLRFPELPSWNAVGRRREYYGDRLNCLGFLGAVIAGLVTLGIIFKFFGDNLWTFLAATAIWMSIGLSWLFWIVLRPPYRTVGDIAQAIAERRQKLLKVRNCSVADIESELRDYMCKSYGLKPEKIRRESELVKDLGLD